MSDPPSIVPFVVRAPSSFVRWTVLLGIAVTGCSSSAVAPGRSPPPTATLVPVLAVTDGDTIHVRYLGRDERVRLIGIDTPEVPWYGGRGECFGPQAGLYARGRLQGKTVALVFDVQLRDRYGRLLAYVYLGRELFNLTLAQMGYARADPIPPDTRMAAAFGSAEHEARTAGRGLWSACPAGT